MNFVQYQVARPKQHKHRLLKALLFLVIISLIVVGVSLRSHVKSTGNISSQTTKAKPVVVNKPVVTVVVNMCANNTLSQLILVSISQRHTWVCDGSKELLNTQVITGNQNIASDLTPIGTYHILVKQSGVHLVGCDIDVPTNCWNDFVNYDLIFLYNKYGHYDFHDAAWRASNDFGNISPYSSNASHGCVETPLSAMAWLYSWASVGTTVVIQS